ncbi:MULTISPECIES: TetR/AcrR family transcriptional regulator [Mycolicibacterium]|uniref:Transcriptional regulator, TetR family n=1 Tax=Mycolicibacterium gilvum (strain PYR-GCK) TaxID=350054 RepID=A4T8W8_MYCGI|nr:TetR family transcriptional regulator [Mycolicibacterium sp. PAM1]ABP44676.1 transcriptional regulator, TetR family [Mycolicibacterium gilvum PYR-GCK]MBV5246982.1 TetR family transcriptional regulator [Mycolicibacterium sp. PAM1]
MRSVDDLTAAARIRDAAVELFGAEGFAVSVRTIAAAAGVSPGLVIHHFGSKDQLHKACDAYVAETVRAAKSESIQTSDPATWLAQMAEIEEYAPLMAYLVRSLQAGGELGKMLWRTMTNDVEQYLEDGVRAGTVKPSADPRARAFFLSMASGGGFLLYLQLHESTDIRVVLRDYSEAMVLPALELYTHGLLTDSTMYDAFVAERAHDHSSPSTGARDA